MLLFALGQTRVVFGRNRRHRSRFAPDDEIALGYPRVPGGSVQTTFKSRHER